LGAGGRRFESCHLDLRLESLFYKGFFVLERTSTDQRKKNIKQTESFAKEFDEYLTTLKNLSL